MRGDTMRIYETKHRSLILLVAMVTLAFSTYIDQVVSFPADVNQWPTFPRRNIAALAREGYLKAAVNGFKRSISTLAKNGQLPTFSSPYDETDKTEEEQDGSHEKRHIASIARMRSYSAMKRNVQALARDGYRGGRSQLQQDKRNIQAMARNGMINKKDEVGGEYYYPFFQNPIPPLSEIDGPFDYNELYDYQQSVNPDMFPPLSQVYKRSAAADEEAFQNQLDDWYLKRAAVGMPMHGLYRPTYVDMNSRSKRYVMSIPDEIEHNGINDAPNPDNANEDKRSVDDSDTLEMFEKRHIGSLARLGLLPSFRFGGGRYSRSGRARLLMPSQEIYRKHSFNENFGTRQYLSGSETEPASYSDDPDIPPPAVPAHTHPTGRILHRQLNNDVPSVPSPLSSPSILTNSIEPFSKNSWQSNAKGFPKHYYYRSLKVPPYHTNGKRYLLIPAVDAMLRKAASSRNSSLPSRWKNQ
ncbi:hypothetical protein O0L34_g418 [Tuta absoluta]|nr:hypothetical protein O0L34_g418 [Tuta absoluta]